MTDRTPARVVDAHVHLWDPARTDWYPYLSRPPGQRHRRRLEDVPPLRRRHLPGRDGPVERREVRQRRRRHRSPLDRGDHRARPQRAGRAAVPTPSSAASRRPTRWPRPSSSSTGRWRRHASAGSARWDPLGDPVPDAGVLRALQERNLVFELMAHPDQLAAAAAQLAGFDDLIVVVEHTGWPRSNSDEERALWRAGIDALAGLGDNVVCKLSGLAMPFGSMRSTPSPRGSSTPSRPSASTAACSPATSPSTRPRAPSTSSTPPSAP